MLFLLTQYWVNKVKIFVLKNLFGDFPSGPVVKTLHFQCRGCGFDPWSGN